MTRPNESPPPLTLTLSLTTEQPDRAVVTIMSYELGRWRNASVPLLPMVGSLALALLAGWLSVVPPFDAAIAGLYGFVGAVLGFLVTRGQWKAR